ncbi:DUF6518 family protein [Modestobacter roseus]|uniref:Uncharacterized protein n=1 Tax=Modestobacter roseus TaxID=1181884 RepID=A0A562ILJ1_9ACTN|nr:DUF6518 family protein [Modestobacter roseus]MQA32262.1 hypothetical protein [Modestobacter roseus]TWH71758.1 hypothetical protein JD78_00256 [Modestobacter roseus]
MTTATGTRSETPRVLGCAGLGLLAGVAAKAGDESGWRWAADLGTYPAAWVLVVALVGWLAPSVRAAAVRAAVFFATMTVAYYAWAALVLDFGWATRLLLAWLLLSATAVPATGAVVHWATRRSGWLPGALLGVPAGLVLGSGATRGLWLTWVQPELSLPDRPVQVAAELVTAAVLVAVLPTDRRTRLWAAVLAVPALLVATDVLDLFRSLV